MGNSSSIPSSTATTDIENYDVFLSFRGEDTRDGFTSHLYEALHKKQIKTFIDKQLVRGEEISQGLLSAIGESKISVIIFSENYAFSKWCLRELAEIMKYREMKKQIVIPVFYHVDPSHVRKQIGSYEVAFAKHENELQEGDDVKNWKKALTEASGISGFDSSETRPESEFVRKIVRDIWNKLYNISPSCDFKGLVGIDKHIERVISLLCLGVPDFRIIGIWGMGGMGKTTIADAVFQLVSHQFEKTYFALCVRAELEKDSSGLIRLRDEILSKVLNEENLKIGSPSIPQSIKRRLNQKKVLIVLDDVDKLAKLEIFAGGLDRFGPGSRIILTTRNKQVLRNWGGDDHNVYKVEGLNHDEALQLFCNYAFKQNHPTEDLKVLSREVVNFSKDVPLVVKVLGSSLYQNSKQDWENAVHKFQRIFNPEIFDVLKISYDGLDEEEKGLFLDLACFDKYRREGDFKPNLLSGREFSLRGLIDKSLVTVDHDHFYKMHDLLREMGREIVRKESPDKLGNRSRLWRQEDVLHTLKYNEGITNAVQGILLNLYIIEDKHLISQAIEKMYNLRTLIIESPFNYGDLLDYFPDELRYLHYERYPLKVLPSSFNPVNLIELNLSLSKIKQLWEGRTCLPKLKRLNLSICENLIKIPDLSDIPSAESINLERCISLLEIHSSTECPKNLHYLKLSECQNLSRFQSNIHIEGSEFSLYGLTSLKKIPHILGNIKRLDLSWSGVEEVPSTIQSLSKLESLNMESCISLKRISKSICKLKSLDWLNLSGCCKLESFPDILEEMELKYLYLSGTAIKSPPLSGLCSLKELWLHYCYLTEISEDIGCLSSLEKLGLEGNIFERLPRSIKKLSKLYHLTLSDCIMLRSLPELPSSLRYLEAMNCKQLIQSLPDESEIELCADGGGSFNFNFVNCLKINQKAVSNLFRDSVLKMQLMGTEKIISLFQVSPPPLPPSRLLPFMSFSYSIAPPEERDEEVKVSICLPGSEIPEWFCYKNIGSSINIPVLRNDCGRSRYIMGFAVCLVIVFEDNIDLFEDYLNVHYGFHIETSDGHKEGFFHELIGGSFRDTELIGSDHIIIGYNLSRKCYEFFQELDTLLANRGMSDYVGTSFEFNLQRFPWWDFNKIAHVEGCEVKYCGIQPIYVHAQIMNSVAINQDAGDTSESNGTEETCEPYPTRI